MHTPTKAEEKRALAKAEARAVAPADNPWSKLAAELDRVLGAPVLKYTKDGRFALSESDHVPDGTRCVARVDLIQTGWVKWRENAVADRRMGAVADSFVPPARDTLGDLEESDWETQPDGSKRDPWQFQMVLPIMRLDTDETFNFTSGSKGGLNAVSKLIRTYGNRLARGEGGLPIVELKADFYKHRVYGKIYFPQFVIGGWTGDDGKLQSVGEDFNDEVPF
jgi:hypothetical protein